MEDVDVESDNRCGDDSPDKRHPSPTPGRARGRLRVVLGVVGLGLAAAYSLQLFTPLRLNTDAITLLSMAASRTDGPGFLRTQFPVGYPAIVWMIESLGLANSASLVFVNLAAMVAALLSFHWIFTRKLRLSPEASAIVCILTATSWVFVKHVTVPLTDIPYFGMSALALTLLAHAEGYGGWRKAGILALGALCCAVAISIRTVGVALIPSLVWAASGGQTLNWLLKRQRLAALGAIATIFFAIVGCYAISSTVYFHQLTSAAQHGSIVATIGGNLAWRVSELGEIAVNLPQSKSPYAVRPLLSIAGAVALMVFLWGIWCRRKAVGASEIYLIAYTLVLFAWPFYDTRFWLPVIPLVVAFAWIGSKHVTRHTGILQRRVAPFLGVYFVTYFLLGAVAIGYSTRITFSSERLPQRYGDGHLSDTYRAALGQPHDPERVNPEALRLLRRFGGLGS